MTQEHTFCFLRSTAEIISSRLGAGESYGWSRASGKVVPGGDSVFLSIRQVCAGARS